MKICPNCNQTYSDDGLNFCLNDGSILNKAQDSTPKTVFFESPRVTNEIRLQPEYQSPPVWQNQSNLQNRPPTSPIRRPGSDQTLPIISLFLGVFAALTGCFLVGIPIGIGAIVAGGIGVKNESTNPERYGGRGVAIGGIVTGALGIALGLFFLILIIL